jgi:hypothetical protein
VHPQCGRPATAVLTAFISSKLRYAEHRIALRSGLSETPRAVAAHARRAVRMHFPENIVVGLAPSSFAASRQLRTLLPNARFRITCASAVNASIRSSCGAAARPARAPQRGRPATAILTAFISSKRRYAVPVLASRVRAPLAFETIRELRTVVHADTKAEHADDEAAHEAAGRAEPPA